MPATKQIDDDSKRAIIFNKLLKELFKEATEYSAFTGERVAIVVESVNGELYSFVTPSPESIVDNNLPGNPSTDLSSEHNTNIMQLQSKVVESERPLVEVKRTKKSPEKVHNESPQVQVAPKMPPSGPFPLHSGSSTGWGSGGADGGFGHNVGSSN